MKFAPAVACLSLLLIAAVTYPAPATVADHIDAALVQWVTTTPRHPLRSAPYRAQVVEAIRASTDRHGLPWATVTAIVCRESSGRADVTGPAGELGLMQVHPVTAVMWRCKMQTPAQQVECGCRILAHHRSRCGTIEGALAAYGSRSGTCKPKRGGKLARMVADRMRLAKEMEK